MPTQNNLADFSNFAAILERPSTCDCITEIHIGINATDAARIAAEQNTTIETIYSQARDEIVCSVKKQQAIIAVDDKDNYGTASFEGRLKTLYEATKTADEALRKKLGVGVYWGHEQFEICHDRSSIILLPPACACASSVSPNG